MDKLFALSFFTGTCISQLRGPDYRWSGNVATDRDTSKPIIYDPSSFFGHNEYEIGIQKEI
jgi:fructosamine-3-kinase